MLPVTVSAASPRRAAFAEMDPAAAEDEEENGEGKGGAGLSVWLSVDGIPELAYDSCRRSAEAGPGAALAARSRRVSRWLEWCTKPASGEASGGRAVPAEPTPGTAVAAAAAPAAAAKGCACGGWSGCWLLKSKEPLPCADVRPPPSVGGYRGWAADFKDVGSCSEPKADGGAAGNADAWPEAAGEESEPDAAPDASRDDTLVCATVCRCSSE